jgi:NAD+-dependent protein deacetylase SIR2
MIAFLAETGRLLRLYTQNIDELETCFTALCTEIPLPPGAPWPRTIQLHGGLSLMTCTKCFARFPLQPAIFTGADTPPCPECQTTNLLRRSEDYRRQASRVLRPPAIGRLRPRITLYGEGISDGVEITSVSTHDAKNIDALLVIGTSVKIPGVVGLITGLARPLRAKGRSNVFWINSEEPRAVKGLADLWTYQVLQKSDEVATALFQKYPKDGLTPSDLGPQ